MTNRRLPAAVTRRLTVGGGLVCCVGAVFVTVHLVGTAYPAAVDGLWVLGTLAIAALVPILRPRIEVVADRLAYGPDGGPLAELTRFVARLATVTSVDDVLPDLARTAAHAVHSPRGEVRVWLAAGGDWRQSWPPADPGVVAHPTADSAADSTGWPTVAQVVADLPGDVRIPLSYGGTAVGRISLDVDESGLTGADRAVLDRLAGPAALALSNVRLTVELRARLGQSIVQSEQLRESRQRLLDAAADQRRRFAGAVARRVQLPLTAARAELTAAGRQLGVPDADGGPTDVGSTDGQQDVAGGAAGGGLDMARTETLGALHALRDLAAGIFPPVLADAGLFAALQVSAADHGSGCSVTDEGPTDRRLPLPVEAAAYFSCQDLLADLAPAGGVAIALITVTDALVLTVAGTRPPRSVTLTLVRDRVDAVGGTVTRSAPDGPLMIGFPAP